MALLLERSFELDRKRGALQSVLIPAEKWLLIFTKPFGYEPVLPYFRWRLPAMVEREAPRRLTSADACTGGAA